MNRPASAPPETIAVNMLELTRQYYARWTGVGADLLDRPGVTAVPSRERDLPLRGYPRPFRLYCLLVGRAVVVSYSPSLEGKLESILQAFGDSPDPPGAEARLREALPGIEHALKLCFEGLPCGIDTRGAVQLRLTHYPDFLAFFLAQHPSASPEGWLEDYFGSLVSRGYAFGVFRDGLLASATDAPDVPFMDDVMVEIGINTLERYRRRGYGRIVVAALLEHLLRNRKVPLWSCASANRASEELALSVGFCRFGEVLMLRSPQ